MQVAPGRGITGETMQFHGTADRWTLAGAATVATLFSSATATTGSPAVTLRTVGAGQAAAFTYDLARSVVYTRQGNPAWAGQKRDGDDGPIRSDDLFFGGGQPSWVDMNKVAIPQADEQQRLLANLDHRDERGPHAAAALLVPAARREGRGGHDRRRPRQRRHRGAVRPLQGRRARRAARSPTGSASARRRTCIPARRSRMPTRCEADGFEIALHLTPAAATSRATSLRGDWADAAARRSAPSIPSLDAPVTNRTHCIAWSDWASEPIVELENGVRLDTNYYYWPAAFVQNRAGHVHRLGHADAVRRHRRLADRRLPGGDADDRRVGHHVRRAHRGAARRCARAAGLLRRVHGQHAHRQPPARRRGRDRGRGRAAAACRWSRRGRCSTWLDGRNGSSFRDLTFTSNRLQFSIARGGAGANGLEAMLPVNGPTGALTTVTRGGATVSTSRRTVKGIEYAVFDAAAGDYVATYGTAPGPGTAPETTITAFTQTGHAAHVEFTATPASSTFQCSLDGSAFAACVSPRDYSGLASGQHTFQVRAIEPGGTPDPTPAARTFTVVSDTPPPDVPGGPESGGPSSRRPGSGSGSAADRVAPRIRVQTRRARMTTGGSISLRATCPADEVRCSVRLRLRRGRAYVGSRALVMSGGQTRSFRLRLRRAARLQLVTDRSLRVTAVAFARDEAGNDAAARTAVQLLAPRGR